MFPCLHTVCLECAKELCQPEPSFSLTFSCPTCRRPVRIPSQGASGLPTNLDARNMVEIMQTTTMNSTANPERSELPSRSINPYCSEHPSSSITNICVTCKVGLCPKCFTTAAIKEHSDHRVLEINEAFDEIKETCDTLAEKGKEVCKLLSTESQNIETKKKHIESLTTSLFAAQKSKNLAAFSVIQKLSILLDETPVGADNQGTALTCDFNLGHFSDRKCTDYALKSALDGLDRGKVWLKSMHFSAESVVCTKLASATVLLDALRLKMYGNEQNDFVEIVQHLWSLSDESESCCQRLVLLGAANLLLSCFEAFKSDRNACCAILGTYGNLADYHSLHANLISSKAVNMLEYCIKQYSVFNRKLPSLACAVVSSFLSNATLKWPDNCPSREDISDILVKTCKYFPLNDSLNYITYVSLHPFISLMSQQVSEAAKYYPVWVLYMCINMDPYKYCPMLIRDGGVPVLKLQSNSDEYVQRLSNMILAKLGPKAK